MKKRSKDKGTINVLAKEQKIKFMQGCSEEKHATGPRLQENLRMGAGVGIIRDAE